MGCGGRASPYRRVHSDAWSYLLGELRPDVSLVQEALLIKLSEAREDHAVTVCDLTAGVEAGTAILSPGDRREATANLSVRPDTTYAVTADVRTPVGLLTVASVHVFPGKYLHADLHRLIVLLRELSVGRPVLVGGDFNASRRFDEVYGGRRHEVFFSAMASAGLHDVHWAIHRQEVQSFWGRQAQREYQLDHFFISSEWAHRVRSCNIVDDDIVRRLSDHAPMLLDLDVAE